MYGDYESIPRHLRQVRLYRRIQAGRIQVPADLLEQYTVDIDDDPQDEDDLSSPEEVVCSEVEAVADPEAAPVGLLGQLGRWISRRSDRP